MHVKVNPNTQVNHEGRLYGAGESLDMTDEDAGPLIAAGTVSPVGKRAAEPAKPKKRAAAVNKAKR